MSHPVRDAVPIRDPFPHVSPPPCGPVKWRVVPVNQKHPSGKIVEGVSTAWRAYEKAALVDGQGNRLHYSEVRCEQVGA